ncbi:MAG: hypothetical protein LBF87_02645 [Treponema sp.]|nr:hypothetical protein [Treponema sp.]
MPSHNACIKDCRESSLHHTLKILYSGEGGRIEVPIDTYMCDGVTASGEIIEVQIGSFSPLVDKVQALTQCNRVKIVHPIIVQKQLELYDTAGTLVSSRKSPCKGTVWDLFNALVHAPRLPLLPQVSVELALVDITEMRIQDGLGSWRRKGVSILNKSLVAYHGSFILAGVDDYRRLIPFGEGEAFTTQDMGERVGIKAALARKALYVLHKLGVVQRSGKRGKAWVYRTLYTMRPLG